MPTTANYGWTIPADTDLVKDGAAAIRTLGNAIDTTAASTFIGGLVLIKTQTFSAVSSQSVNDVFSSTYNNYRIVLDVIGSTAINVNFRLRVSGTDTTTGYSRQYIYADSTSLSAARSTGGTGWLIADANSTTRSAVIMDCLNPFLSVATNLSSFSSSLYPTANSIAINNYGQDSGTSFTSFTLFPNTGTMTGTVRVYGYKN